MRFGILGPVRAADAGGQPVPLGGARLRALLAMLLLDAGRPVPQGRLIDGLYGEHPPAGAANALQSQVSRLRRLLPVEFDGAGYRLAIDPDEVDVHRFARLAALGRAALADGSPARAVEALRDALSVWRGDPLADVRTAPFAAAQVTRLVEARRRVVEEHAEASLSTGTPRAIIGGLRDLVAADPFRERAWALLMRALAAEGRPAEALTVFADARRILADELGADPSPELSVLHAALLRAEHPSEADRGFAVGRGPAGKRRPAAVDGPARLHGLPVAEVAARVGDRFRLLSRGSRTAPERQRTLRAVVEWSWELLSVPERALARRFTIFRGGAGLAAIEAVCGLGPDTVDLLADLVSKSLIERDGDRYRMLETIRAFCAERRDDAGESATLRARHAAFFLETALTADPLLRGARQLDALRRLDADRDNLQAAVRDADPETALRLLSALSFYWWLRGLRAEAADLARAVLNDRGLAGNPDLAEEHAVGTLIARLGAAPAPQVSGSQEISGMKGAPEVSYLAGITAPPRQPFLLYLSAIVSGPLPEWQEDLPEIHERLRAGLRGDPWSEALAAIGAGWMVLLDGGPPDRAEREFRAALDSFRALGERWGTMIALNSLAELDAARGDQDALRERMDAALRLADELGSTVDAADLLRSRAEIRLATGDVDGASADFTRAVALARGCGALELISAALLGLGRLALRRGDRPEAKRLCLAALAECPWDWFSSYGIRVTILALLGRIAAQDGDDAEAGRRFREVLALGPGPDGTAALTEAVAGLAALTARAEDTP
ncbi:AfsR/SARP family transcriptional regulator [Catenuloplanes japonicus]|uniref:AfsR/SARP family transcriptional regulator n=1 Tax=Catenuloplanes japonicus TaxID=33876 RepID=UPI00068B4B97|nr:BTAD domain-containing putative transcriptional regulator [Catenuloplanes japonicus]